MPNFYYSQQVGGEEAWRGTPAEYRPRLEFEERPAFITVLAVSHLVELATPAEKAKLHYTGPLYFDWDAKNCDDATVIVKVNQFLDNLEKKRVDLNCCRLYATGGRGYHLEIPMAIFNTKPIPKGVPDLPKIYREMAWEMAVDTLDLTIYSGSRGRMWRVPGIERSNGRYKVPITVQEMREMTPELNLELTSKPRHPVPVRAPEFSADLAVLYSGCAQKVGDMMKARREYKPDPNAAKRAGAESIKAAMMGLGLREDAGFHEIVMQLSVAATTAGLTEDQFVAECAGLISTHKSDGDRYNSEGKRAEELRRMHRYMQGNECFTFSVGGVKKLLTHSAPDLDGIPMTAEEVKEHIEENNDDTAPGATEYGDVTRGYSLNKWGIWKWSPEGNKRICAVSFAHTRLLLSLETNAIVGYYSDVLVHGKSVGYQMLESDVFDGQKNFYDFSRKHGHAFNGNDAEVRVVMMRFAEAAKKKGANMYVVQREGVDLIRIPLHEVEELRKPIVIWADNTRVVMPKWAEDLGLSLTFQGYPDQRGLHKVDIVNAPDLLEWIEEPGNRERMRKTLHSLMSCQKPDLMAKLIGWYVACFWRQLFHAAYKKFPLLHVNGAAGVGKTETNTLLAHMFYYADEPRLMSPSSTKFSLMQMAASSASIPLIIDEYKPMDMTRELHNQMRFMFREAYNQRAVMRGGGTRESDDYRSLQQTALSAPIVFISEAAESEAAVMERVVLATFARPPEIIGQENAAKFREVTQNAKLLGIIGGYLASYVVHEYDTDKLYEQFEVIFEAARAKYMLSADDLKNPDLSQEDLRNKRNAKERSVYNHAVAQFGFQQWRRLVSAITKDAELDELMASMEMGVYGRLADLNAATTPENIKVLIEMAQISLQCGTEKPESIVHGVDYAFVQHGSRSCIELAIAATFSKYSMYSKMVGQDRLFSNREQFMLSLRDSPVFVKEGAQVLDTVPVFTLDVEEMAKFGVPAFKPGK